MALKHWELSFGLVDGTPVFMDLAADSYFRLDPDEEKAFLGLVEPTPSRPAIELGAATRSGGRGWTIRPIAAPRATGSALEGARSRAAGLAAVLGAARTLAAIRQDLRTRRIADIIPCDLAARPAPGPAPQELLEHCERFRSARRLVPIGGNCLSNSLALVRWLGERGQGATLVFGAKLDPFAAHCWVQSGELLLNEHPEMVERFTPVRLVECMPATR